MNQWLSVQVLQSCAKVISFELPIINISLTCDSAVYII